MSPCRRRTLQPATAAVFPRRSGILARVSKVSGVPRRIRVSLHMIGLGGVGTRAAPLHADRERQRGGCKRCHLPFASEAGYASASHRKIIIVGAKPGN